MSVEIILNDVKNIFEFEISQNEGEVALVKIWTSDEINSNIIGNKIELLFDNIPIFNGTCVATLFDKGSTLIVGRANFKQSTFDDDLKYFDRVTGAVVKSDFFEGQKIFDFSKMVFEKSFNMNKAHEPIKLWENELELKLLMGEEGKIDLSFEFEKTFPGISYAIDFDSLKKNIAPGYTIIKNENDEKNLTLYFNRESPKTINVNFKIQADYLGRSFHFHEKKQIMCSNIKHKEAKNAIKESIEFAKKAIKASNRFLEVEFEIPFNTDITLQDSAKVNIFNKIFEGKIIAYKFFKSFEKSFTWVRIGIYKNRSFSSFEITDVEELKGLSKITVNDGFIEGSIPDLKGYQNISLGTFTY